MKPVRSFSTLFLTAAITLGAAAALVTPPAAAAGDDKCVHNPKFEPLKKACQSGRKAAKDLMNGYKKQLQGKGVDFKCSSCHEDQKTYPLKSNGQKDFDALRAKYPDIIK